MADDKTKEPKEEKKQAKGAADAPEEKKEKALSPDAKREAKKEKEKKGPTEKKVKKVDYGPDFKYIVRIANTDLDGTKTVELALSGIKGIGTRMGTLIADLAGVNRFEKIGKLHDPQIESLAKTVEEIGTKVPSWMVNRQFDWESGQDLHLTASNVDIILRDDLNRLKKIRSFRGVRHEAGLPVRGQRTRSHGRTGLTVGVQRTKEAAPAEKKEEGAPAAPAAPRGGGGAKPLGGAKPAAAPAAGAPAAGGAKPAAPAGGKPAAKPEGGKK